ncbi:helix-turn-helix domain-containing protein [Saccharomonospora glauca]|jgi:transcriptional regulator with XRE-family HTH domain|uniref:Putative transcriptional regulator n=1 Tax=Saccharomonospora glauca K62 TaxID=928724 RepID=I1D5C0_9PSEU|nr:helix-turn-helix transcriptional regulator [Saccharomonospora glauca]EIF00145.1 putative transcriptional regulator [Saccharomonospora glauca K62]
MQEIGARIKALRGKLLTQKQLADAAGVSVDVIRKLEQGTRKTAAIGTLTKIARALDVSLPELLGQRTSVPTGEADGGVVALRQALSPIDDLIGDITGEPITLDDARRAVDYAWSAYWGGQYDHLATILPSTLPQLRATMHAASADQRSAAAELLARAYWVTGCTLVHLGQTDIAWQSIRLAHDTSGHGSDELLTATIRGSIAWQLLVQGRYDESHRVAVRTAETIEPRGDVPLPHLSAYGSLILTAATASGRARRVGEAQHLVGQAAAVAGRMGVDRHDYETYFGPSQVVMQTVDVCVVTEDYAGALDAAKRMPRGTALPLASRCRHLADQAFAHARLGHAQRAVDALLIAESMGPDWIRHQTLPRRIVGELLERDRQSRLRSLARRLSVTG